MANPLKRSILNIVILLFVPCISYAIGGSSYCNDPAFFHNSDVTSLKDRSYPLLKNFGTNSKVELERPFIVTWEEPKKLEKESEKELEQIFNGGQKSKFENNWNDERSSDNGFNSDAGNDDNNPIELVAPEKSEIYVDADKITIMFSEKEEDKDNSSNKNDKEGDSNKNLTTEGNLEITLEDLKKIIPIKNAGIVAGLITPQNPGYIPKQNEFSLTLDQYICTEYFVSGMRENIENAKQNIISINLFENNIKLPKPHDYIDYGATLAQILTKLQEIYPDPEVENIKNLDPSRSLFIDPSQHLCVDPSERFFISKKQLAKLSNLLELFRGALLSKTKCKMSNEAKNAFSNGKEKFAHIKMMGHAPEKIGNLIYNDLNNIVLPQHNAKEYLSKTVNKKSSKCGWNIYTTNDPNIHIAVLHFSNPNDANIYAHFLTENKLPAIRMMNSKTLYHAIEIILKLNNEKKIKQTKKLLAQTADILKKYYFFSSQTDQKQS